MSLKCNQNQHSLFSRSAPSLLFHTTKYQFFTSSFVIQPLGWYLTMIPLGSCSVVNVLQFRITYGGNLLPSARLPTWLLHTCHNLFQLPEILPHCHLQFDCMAYKNTLAFHRHFLFGSWRNCYFFKVQSHIIDKQQATLRNLLAISGKVKFFYKTVNPFLHIICAHQTMLAMKHCHGRVIWQVPTLYTLLSCM